MSFLWRPASCIYCCFSCFTSFSANRGQTKCRRLPDAAALCMLAFFTCTVVASFLSEYPQDVLLGQRNRYQGLLTVSVYTALVFALSRQAFDLRYAEAALAASGSIAGMLGVLNHFGVDPLGFMVNLSPADQGRFISTLGNADFYGSFLCLAFPVTFGWFCRERRLLGRFLSAGALFIVSLGSMVAGSDSTALGLIVAAFAFPPILMDEKTRIAAFLHRLDALCLRGAPLWRHFAAFTFRHLSFLLCRIGFQTVGRAHHPACLRRGNRWRCIKQPKKNGIQPAAEDGIYLLCFWLFCSVSSCSFC